MKILLISGFRGTSIDPYLKVLYDPIIAQGHEVRELRNGVAIRRYDIVHVHWIDSWNRPYDWLKKRPYAQSAAAMFLCLYFQLIWLKLLGSKIVWTVHNLYPHDSKQPKLDRELTLRLIGLFDGWISLSESATQLAIDEYPPLASKANKVIVHAHYRSAYPAATAKSAAREQLGLSAKESVILYFGWIRPYKGVDLLITTFRKLKSDSTALVVAGGALPKSLADFLQKLVDEDERILYIPRSQSPQEVAVLFSAADLVVFPYRKFLNSGAAILSLSFGVPCLVRNAPTMIDLQKVVGAQWVRLLDGELNVQSLQDGLAWSTNEGRPRAHDLTSFEPELLSLETVRFYERLLAT